MSKLIGYSFIFLGFLMGLVSLVALLSPIYFTIQDNNPWYMFTFLITWAPAVIFAALGKAFFLVGDGLI